MTKEPCECKTCSELRMLTAWCLLENVDDLRTRICARMLLRRWERALVDGNNPSEVEPTQLELDAIRTCVEYLRDNGATLSRMHRDVGVSGDP